MRQAGQQRAIGIGKHRLVGLGRLDGILGTAHVHVMVHSLNITLSHVPGEDAGGVACANNLLNFGAGHVDAVVERRQLVPVLNHLRMHVSVVVESQEVKMMVHCKKLMN